MMSKNLLAAMALMMGSGTAMATCADVDAAAGPQVAAVIAMIQSHTSGGFGLPMWWGVVDETGKVCGIRNSSPTPTSNNSWLGSRIIAVQKAYAANAFSLNGFSISTANLYGLTIPGGSLFSLTSSNLLDASTAYLGAPETYGTVTDPLIGKRLGGLITFGGGLALYNAAGVKVGALGVSGDTSCTDHAVAWQIRALWGLDHVPGGFVTSYHPAPEFPVKGDEIVIKLSSDPLNLQNTYKHPTCGTALNPPQGATTGVILEP